MKKKSLKITVSILLAGIIGIGGYFVSKQYAGNRKTSNTSSNYIIETVKKSDINVSIKSTGTVYASITKDIVANNSGELKEMSVKEGDIVKKGDTLFKVDSEQVRQQLNSAEINLEKQKLQLDKMKTQDEINLQNLQVEDAEKNLEYQQQQYNNMVVTSPINGMITTKNNNNGDNVQSGKTILSITDTSSLKIKASVDELDISKVKIGQKVQIKFNAIEGKTYEGTVESISNVGQENNNVTTYDVVINLKDKTGVMIGMTANIDIQVASKKDVLSIPIEALIEKDGKKYVMVQQEDGENSKANTTESNENVANKKNEVNNSEQGKRLGSSTSKDGTRTKNNYMNRGTGRGNLVEVTTGLENENYIEIVKGLKEGQKIMIALPEQSSSTSNKKNQNKAMDGMGGGMMGGSRPSNK